MLPTRIRENDPSLTALHLNTRHINTKGAIDLENALSCNDAITDLDLAWKSIGADGAKRLADMLCTNGKITRLNLEGGFLGDKGAIALEKALNGGSGINCLILKENKIGDKGVRALVDALLQIEACKPAIDLSSNCITSKGTKLLAKNLRSNTTIPLAMKRTGQAIGIHEIIRSHPYLLMGN